LKSLIAQGGDINKNAGVIGLSTPLIQACRSDRMETIKWLIDHGANVPGVILMVAGYNDRLEILKYLLALDKERNLFTEEDKSAAMFRVATKKNTRFEHFDTNIKMLEMFFEHGANPNYIATSGEGKNKTTVELMRKLRSQNSARIGANRYGPSSLEYEKRWLKHRDTIIELLEKEQAHFEQSQ
jgi:ankyrin repeat protein